MKIGVKITLGFCLVILVLLSMGGTSYYSAGNVESQMTAIQRSSQRVELVSAVDQSFTEGIAATRGYMVYGKETFVKQTLEKFDEAAKNATALLQVARPEKMAQVEKLIIDIKQYRDAIQSKLFPVVQQYHRDKSAGTVNAVALKALEDQFVEIGATLVPIAEAITKTTHAQVTDNRKAISDQMAASASTVSTVKVSTLSFGIAALLIVIVVSVFLTRMVTKPLVAVSEQLDEMGQGRFDKDIDSSYMKRRDEFGDMSRSFDRMQSSVRKLLGQVSQERRATGSLFRRVNRQRRAVCPGLHQHRNFHHPGGSRQRKTSFRSQRNIGHRAGNLRDHGRSFCHCSRDGHDVRTDCPCGDRRENLC